MACNLVCVHGSSSCCKVVWLLLYRYSSEVHAVMEAVCCFAVLQIAALMKDKAALEVKVSQAVAAPTETYQQIDTVPKYGCKTCG